MSNSQSRQQEIRNAALAAVRESQRLKIVHGSRVDIFDVIEQAGIWLMFEKFKTIYGCYQRVEDVAGIQINANHPLSLQRFTAAHEYGHHVLGHTESVDDVHSIQPGQQQQPISDKELAAQTFAAHFLMPLPMVNATLQRLGLPLSPPTMTYSQVYRFSLELGVSYAAAVTHLGNSKKLAFAAVKHLRGIQPKDIKTILGQGSRPADSRADLWELDERDNGHVLYPRVNDEIYITLPEIPSSGYIWSLIAPATIDLRTAELETEILEPDIYLAIIRDSLEIGDVAKQKVGGGGQRQLGYRLLRPGRFNLRLEKRRPWQQSTSPAAIFEATLEVSARQTGEADRGLSSEQKRLIAA